MNSYLGINRGDRNGLRTSDIIDFILRLICRAGLVVGPLSLAVCLVFSTYTVIFVCRARATHGLVVELSPASKNDAGKTEFAPVFTYDVSGQRYTVVASTQSAPPEFAVGANVKVLYLTTNPDKGRIASFWQLWLVPFVTGIMGIFWTGVGLITRWYQSRQNNGNVSFVLVQPS